ncbi:MAG TPA: arginine--tRNA ligase [Candidatus Avisuccinivibrio pullicola]|nr:arginine--tRNA ligase [Candidatus Avisuccinivibrio pullicola]
MKEQLVSLIKSSLQQLSATYDIDKNLLSALRVDRTRDKSHGDFASNVALMLSKSLHQNPRALAEEIIAHLPHDPRIAKTEIAGPGFINFFVSDESLCATLSAMLADPRLGVAKADKPQRVVVDYSAPNVAKEMAVHHIRSTVIGDAVVRTLEFLGHDVIRANHVGDWGTQFGMLIAYLERKENESGEGMDLSDFEAFYREAKQAYDSDPDFAVTARRYVVLLQGGDPYCKAMWQKLVTMTMEQNQRIYDRLDVTLTEKDVMGESLYNPMLPGIVADLTSKGLAVEDDGAMVVYLNEFTNRDGQPMGVIVRKKDGGYLYTTTDIACVKYRVDTLKAERILYFIDSRQHQHLMEAWTIARKAGYLPANVSVEHDAFGMMLGRDGRPFKTRTGGTVKLKDLLDEAEERVSKLLEERGSALEGDIRREVIHNIAVGAVKYADLSKNRTTDYIFDWDLMLAFDGNTAPYLQYAYSRIRAIFRKTDKKPGNFILNEEAETALANKLTAFPEAVRQVGDKAMPHLLCTYLYELSGTFMRFYESCPVLKEGVSDEVRASRLALCDLTSRVLKQGLNLLGIRVMEQM